jgi:hypothetical protein
MVESRRYECIFDCSELFCGVQCKDFVGSVFAFMQVLLIFQNTPRRAHLLLTQYDNIAYGFLDR